MTHREHDREQTWVVRELERLRGPCPVQVDVRARVLAAIRTLPVPWREPVRPGVRAVLGALAATLALCAMLLVSAWRLWSDQHLLLATLREGGVLVLDMMTAARVVLTAVGLTCWTLLRDLAMSAWQEAMDHSPWIEGVAAVTAMLVVLAALAVAAHGARRTGPVRHEEV